MTTRGLSHEERFDTHVRLEVGPLLSPCWVWKSARSAKGYAWFWTGLRRPDGAPVMQHAHRWAFEHWCGPVPEGLQLDHLCKNPACVNYAHLEPVTAKENCHRGR